jgi:phosphatidylglycerol:prolipoprotein diacylglycerol transferase
MCLSPMEGISIPIGAGFCIHYYGIIIMLGAVVAGFVGGAEAKRRGQNPEVVWDALVWLIIGGVIGARLWHVLIPSATSAYTTAYYLTHPFNMIAIWDGGLGIPGAVIGGVIALYLYCRRNGLPFATWADIAAPCLALGQAIGRWGNYFNQELYGAPTNLPWHIYIDPAHRLKAYAAYEYYHPLFLYESLYNLANMFFLLFIGRRFKDWLKPGDVFIIYLITYPLGRFLLEFLRLDIAATAGGLNINQTIMAIVAVCAAIVLYWRHRPSMAAQPTGDQ